MSRYPDSVDVVIVGSGPTGSAYARIISESAPELTIALLEVGPTVSAPPGGHVKNIVDPDERSRAQVRSEGPGAGNAEMDNPEVVREKKRTARPGTFLLEKDYQFPGEDGLPLVAMSSNVGGMAAHWTAACPRPQASERITYIEELDELLDEGERLLGVTRHEFDGAPYSDLVRERLGAAVDEGRSESTRVQRMPLAVHRREEDGALVWSGADVVLGDVTRANPNFRLIDESLVRRVIVEDGRAAGVEVEDLRSGESAAIRARFVVVAADSLRSPQLLWASGIRPDALGRYLNDQTQMVFSTRIKDAPAELVAEAMALAQPTEDGRLRQQSGVSWVPFTDEAPFHGQIMQLDTSPIAVADDDPVAPGSVVGIGVFSPKEIRYEDRIEFSDDETDAYGMPAISVHYTLTEKDHALLDRAREWSMKLANAVGEPQGPAPMLLPLGASLHYQGTIRMSETDDGASVCDPYSRVWGVGGLFVAGNGIIPTATACNPTVTSVGLAVRGARKLIESAS